MSGVRPVMTARPRRGFALLLIFALAGAVAVLLYLELPRAVFESARAKEDLLVERGEQYKLAIRRYFVKTKQLPNSIEQLENTNGVRFLRRRYKDPMTGEDEWRLVHWGAGGYTDSKVFKPKEEGKSDSRPGSVGQGYQVGGAGGGPAEANEKGQQDVAFRQRPSDRLPQGGQGTVSFQSPPESPNPNPGDPPPLDQALFDPSTGQQIAVPGAPAPLPGRATPNPPGNPIYPGQQFIPGQGQVIPQPSPGFPPNPGFPGATANPVNSQTGGTVPVAIGGSPFGNASAGAPPAAGIFPGQPGYPNPQQQNQQAGRPVPGAGGNPAADMIRNLLTQPRPGPSGATGTPTATGSTPLPAGIAGVASKGKGIGIKRINDREKIDEWEFLFDPSQPTRGVAGAGQMGGVGGGPANPANPANPGGSTGSAGSGLGQGGFGQGGFGQGQAGFSQGSGRPPGAGFNAPGVTPPPGRGRRP